jgi:ubiquinone/menaquinone biosynthesis C-methylase UbiE
MLEGDSQSYGDERYFTRLAAAFVRGKLSRFEPHLADDDLIASGLAAGLRLHKFKRNTELPRVRKVLGVLRGLAPASLLDVGSGRGTFLWPLLDAFSELPVTSIDINPVRVADIAAVGTGGVSNLRALQMSVEELKIEDKYADVVTALEVFEHLDSPRRAAAEVMRVAGRYVVASVPSKEDDNPEHIHLFDAHSLEALFLDAGARGVKVEHVLNHMIAVVKV